MLVESDKEEPKVNEVVATQRQFLDWLVMFFSSLVIIGWVVLVEERDNDVNEGIQEDKYLEVSCCKIEGGLMMGE